MGRDALGRGGGEVALGKHRQVGGQRGARHLAAHGRGHPLGHRLARGPLALPAGQVREGARVEVPEDLGLPAGHDPGAHRAHVRAGEQVEHAQALRRPADRGQRLDRLRVVDVAPLGDVRHGQVVGHQEDHLVGVLGGEPDARGEGLDERDALGHVSVPPPLADVVQEHPHHQQPRTLQLAHHLRVALRVRRRARREGLQVLHRDQRVLVGAELVVDVVLHEAGQRVPLGQVPAQHSQLVHLAEGLGDPAPVAGDAEEEVAGLRRGAEGVVDQIEGVLDAALYVDAQLEPELMAVPEHLEEPQRVLAEGAPVRLGQV